MELEVIYREMVNLILSGVGSIYCAVTSTVLPVDQVPSVLCCFGFGKQSSEVCKIFCEKEKLVLLRLLLLKWILPVFTMCGMWDDAMNQPDRMTTTLKDCLTFGLLVESCSDIESKSVTQFLLLCISATEQG